MKILINAYACSPDMGSEPGMAWNWCLFLAKYCELHIITEGEFRERIEVVLPTLPYGQNMHFYYNPVSDKVRRMCWNQGDWRFYWYYRKWQRKTYHIADEICRTQKVDILHQLNMIGFREPGYLWELSEKTGIPFVWGPVDAKDTFPMAYLKGASLKTRAFLMLKNTITRWQLKHGIRIRKAASSAKVVLSASSNSVRSFKKYLHIDSLLMNETGCSMIEVMLRDIPKENKFDILWVGKTDYRKQLVLALRSIALLDYSDIRLHIVGGGDEVPFRRMAESLGIMNLCVWHGVVSHNEVQRLMQQANLFFFTSVAEGTPHVVLEAIANHLPVLCFDTCGQGDVVNEKVGIKIALSNPEQSVEDFARQIGYLYGHREVLKQLSLNCRERQLELTWERKVETMVKYYKQIVIGG